MYDCELTYIAWLLTFSFVLIRSKCNRAEFWCGGSSALLITVLAVFFYKQNIQYNAYLQRIWGGYLSISLRGWPFNLATFQERIFHDESEGRWLTRALPWMNLVTALAVIAICRALWWRFVLRPGIAHPARRRFQFGLSTLLSMTVAAGALMGWLMHDFRESSTDWYSHCDVNGTPTLLSEIAWFLCRWLPENCVFAAVDAALSVSVLYLVFIAAEARANIRTAHACVALDPM